MRRPAALALFLSCAFGATVQAEPPNVQTPSPVIHLADNLDEPDRLGWCIDTQGRGYSDNLHVHSCKPQGGDVQFRFDAQSGQIASVAFDGKCVERIAAADPATPFGLRDCADGASEQRFDFDPQTGRITPGDAPGECLAAGGESRQAGPFLSRDLTLAVCETADPTRATWGVRP